MTEFSPDDPLVGVFDRYQSEVSAQVMPAAAALHRAAHRHRLIRSTGIVLALALVVAAWPAAYVAFDRHRAAPSTVVPTGPWTSPLDCPGSRAPLQVPPSPNFGPGENGPAPDTGPLIYLQGGSDTGSLHLVSWTPGKSAVVPLREVPVEAWMNVNVSPDHRWVSWVAAGGALHLATLTGAGPDRVLRESVDGQVQEPVWSADSTRLLITDLTTHRVGTIDIASGAFTELPASLVGAQHAVWAADGSGFAYLAPEGGVVVVRPDGSGQRRVPMDASFVAEGRRVTSLQSLSGIGADDGELGLTVAGAGAAGSPCRSLTSNIQIRIGDGSWMLDPAQRGGRYDLFQGIYRDRADAHLSRGLSNPRTLELIGTNGEFQGGVNEPAALAGYYLLS